MIIAHCCRVLEEVGLIESSDLTQLEKEGIEIEIKYAGFVKRQQASFDLTAAPSTYTSMDLKNVQINKLNMR